MTPLKLFMNSSTGSKGIKDTIDLKNTFDVTETKRHELLKHGVLKAFQWIAPVQKELIF